MRLKRNEKSGKTEWLAVCIAVMLFVPFLTMAAEDTLKVSIRDKIINLIEGTLSEAYSFSGSSLHPVPHFEVLDKVYPKWHHGDPAVARQFWVNAGYLSFTVLYRVDYVHIVNEVSARVEGKRLILWNQQEGGADFSEYWPFQLWASLPNRTHRDNSYLSAMYPMRYKMKLAMDEKGNWYIVEEQLRDIPEMANNLKNHCLYEEQLKDWGLKNDCNKKLLPQ